MADRLGIQRWSFDYNIGRIYNAYQASRSSFDNDRSRLETAMKEHLTNDPDSDYFDDYQEHLIDQNHNAELGIVLIREAFVMTLYHFWEKSAMGWLNKKRYEVPGVITDLQANNYLVEVAEIDRLRMTTNAIKHNSGALYGKHPDMFDPSIKDWINEGVDAPFHRMLQVSDADMEAFFEAVRKSGPNAKPSFGF